MVAMSPLAHNIFFPKNTQEVVGGGGVQGRGTVGDCEPKQ